MTYDRTNKILANDVTPLFSVVNVLSNINEVNQCALGQNLERNIMV